MTSEAALRRRLAAGVVLSVAQVAQRLRLSIRQVRRRIAAQTLAVERHTWTGPRGGTVCRVVVPLLALAGAARPVDRGRRSAKWGRASQIAI